MKKVQHKKKDGTFVRGVWDVPTKDGLVFACEFCGDSWYTVQGANMHVMRTHPEPAPVEDIDTKVAALTTEAEQAIQAVKNSLAAVRQANADLRDDVSRLQSVVNNLQTP
jgi:hypothetical protein